MYLSPGLFLFRVSALAFSVSSFDLDTCRLHANLYLVLFYPQKIIWFLLSFYSFLIGFLVLLKLIVEGNELVLEKFAYFMKFSLLLIKRLNKLEKFVLFIPRNLL